MGELQRRSWLLTIADPMVKGLDHDAIKKLLAEFGGGSPDYWCMCDEEGGTGLYHTHLYIYRNNPIRLSEVKDAFPNVHTEVAFMSFFDNLDYVAKSGRYKKLTQDSGGKEISYQDTFEESGDFVESVRFYHD